MPQTRNINNNQEKWSDFGTCESVIKWGREIKKNIVFEIFFRMKRFSDDFYNFNVTGCSFKLQFQQQHRKHINLPILSLVVGTESCSELDALSCLVMFDVI